MYGDTAKIRQLAHQLRDRATDLRCEARGLSEQVAAVRWTGRAADAMRAFAERRLQQLLECAHRHDDAAVALERHAAAVDHLKQVIAEVEHRARALVHGARARLTSLTHQALAGVAALTPDPVDEALDRFVPPPPGHLDWLGVRLPGLGR
ncbi:putative T7SS-secreted protein [Nocardioides sp.]|uniref:putative T7SS-secreted protein n=1 Tax=Nocardioides sp. TaxID=35761 RepID=UPI003D0DB689